MDYGYPTNKETSVDPSLLKELSTMKISIEEILKRLAKIEKHLERLKSK